MHKWIFVVFKQFKHCFKKGSLLAYIQITATSTSLILATCTHCSRCLCILVNAHYYSEFADALWYIAKLKDKMANEKRSKCQSLTVIHESHIPSFPPDSNCIWCKRWIQRLSLIRICIDCINTCTSIHQTWPLRWQQSL